MLRYNLQPNTWLLDFSIRYQIGESQKSQSLKITSTVNLDCTSKPIEEVSDTPWIYGYLLTQGRHNQLKLSSIFIWKIVVNTLLVDSRLSAKRPYLL